MIREDRSREVCRKQEKLILEKSEAVNQLAQQLEDSQRQLRQYLTEEGGTTLLRAQLEASTREQNRLQNQLQDSMVSCYRFIPIIYSELTTEFLILLLTLLPFYVLTKT